MEPNLLEPLERQEAVSADEATIAAIELAQAEFRRGEGVPLEEARAEVRKNYEARLKTQKAAA